MSSRGHVAETHHRSVYMDLRNCSICIEKHAKLQHQQKAIRVEQERWRQEQSASSLDASTETADGPTSERDYWLSLAWKVAFFVGGWAVLIWLLTMID